MSSKSSKPQGKKLSVPRELDLITKDYQQKCAEAGMLQYRVAMDKEALVFINNEIKALNHEAAARQKLNGESQIKSEVAEIVAEAKSEEVSNEA